MEKKPPSVRLPGLCGGSWSSPGRPSPHWRQHTCSTTCPETNCPSWIAGSRTDSRSPWTQTPGTGENTGCTRRRAGPACGGTASCRSQKCAGLGHQSTRQEWVLNCIYIITLASSRSSSSDMHPSLIIFTATFLFIHWPSSTSPNWPLPISWPRVSSLGFSSQWSAEQKPSCCYSYWPTLSALMLFKVQLRYRNHFKAPYHRKNQKPAGRNLCEEIQGVSSVLLDLLKR